MAQFETTGGGTIDSGDKRIERKVIVSTSGADPTAPIGTGRLTNVSITQEAGGIRRGVFEYTQGGVGGASYNAYGKKIELMGGSREVPIINHPYFATLYESEILRVQKAIDEKENVIFTNPVQAKLFDYLARKIEYILVPSISARVSEIESNLPRITGLCKVDNPSGLNAPDDTFWVMTGISATPVGDKYEVTREYTSIPATWQDVDFLYNYWD